VGIYETFSKRLKKRERAGQVDVYQYDELPGPLRIQIIHIWGDAIGPSGRGDFAQSGAIKAWDAIHNTLARELGVFALTDAYHTPSEIRCKNFLLNASISEALDIIELSFHVIQKRPQIMGVQFMPSFSAEKAIDELNYRFREHAVGYQFVGGQIIRVDSQYVHAEVVKPAISLLNTAGFEGASEEFLKAHEEYRSGDYPGAITNALKAFESTMKSICDKNSWSYASGANAKQLIKVCLDNWLVPKYSETHLAAVRNTLEHGLPTVRNKDGGHGQGPTPKNVPQHLAGYALHLAATNIVFLVEAHEALNRK
jgi:hypothetical protein